MDLTHIQNILTYRFDDRDKSSHLDISDFTPTNLDPNAVHVQELLENILSDRLARYDHIALTLSSGVDSTLLLALIRKIFPEKKITAITLSFLGSNSEAQRAKELAEKYNAQHINITEYSILMNLPNLAKHTNDLGRWNTYQYISALTAKEMKADCLVTGDGADELFCGYTFRYKNIGEGYSKNHRNDYVPDQDDIFQKKTKFIPDYSDNLLQCIIKDWNGKLLHDFIPTTKLISKKYHIPIITPYLDKELVKFCTHLPISEKFDGELGKLHLRTISKRIGLEQSPSKVGFSPNLIKEWGMFGDQLKAYLLSPKRKIYTKKIINRSWVLKHINDQSLPYLNKLTQLLALELKL